MTNQECETAFKRIEEILEKNELNWIIDEIEAEINLGKTLTKRVLAQPDFPEELAVRELFDMPRRRTTVVSATRPYTSKEQLLLIIDAVQHAAVETFKMEEAVRRCVSKNHKKWESVQLLNADDRQRPPLDISSKADTVRAKSVQELSHLLSTLRSLV